MTHMILILVIHILRIPLKVLLLLVVNFILGLMILLLFLIISICLFLLHNTTKVHLCQNSLKQHLNKVQSPPP